MSPDAALESLASRFEVEDMGQDEWHLTCRSCGHRWALAKPRGADREVRVGNVLALLDHAASHEGRAGAR